MSDQTIALLLLVAGVVIFACVIGAIIAIASAFWAARARRREGLGEEDVASILGYPMWPVHTPNGTSRQDDDGAAA